MHGSLQEARRKLMTQQQSSPEGRETFYVKQLDPEALKSATDSYRLRWYQDRTVEVDFSCRRLPHDAFLKVVASVNDYAGKFKGRQPTCEDCHMDVPVRVLEIFPDHNLNDFAKHRVDSDCLCYCSPVKKTVRRLRHWWLNFIGAH